MKKIPAKNKFPCNESHTEEKKLLVMIIPEPILHRSIVKLSQWMIGIKEKLDYKGFYLSLLSIRKRIYLQKNLFDRNKLEASANIDALKSDRELKVHYGWSDEIYL
ncbi:hypothetical protein CDAR_396461 [Caerostris darwini]|uniref:Uncharacterized protein n=1 Tax=Caerostris darwini TaxID=1538125 RepID=A0AAV4SWU4_9ARAC|nr:hypothetical protein CDAR_396461 [Caerostris darwini]